jgi:hypothetical protein
LLQYHSYKYAVSVINAKGQPFPSEPLIMALLLSQHKMIDWLTKQISKNESLAGNKEVMESKQQQEQDLGKEVQIITSERMKEFIILTMIISEGDYMTFHECYFASIILFSRSINISFWIGF